MSKTISIFLILVLLVAPSSGCSGVTDIEPTISSDKTALSSLIATANSITEAKYTTATYTALQEAISHAEKILRDNKVSQEAVDAETITLQDSINSLKAHTSCIWEITFTLVCTARNHVGSDWKTTVRYNGTSVQNSFKVTASEGSSISLTGEAIEDDNIPDVGSGTVRLILRDGSSANTTFYVRENRGRYSGYQATWFFEVSCEIFERV